MKKRTKLLYAAFLLQAVMLTGCSGMVSTEERTDQEQTAADVPQQKTGTEETPQETEPAGEQTSGNTPAVYMTTDISSEGLMAIYEALGAELPDGNIAVKISTGETGSNYLRPELIGDLVQKVI